MPRMNKQFMLNSASASSLGADYNMPSMMTAHSKVIKPLPSMTLDDSHSKIERLYGLDMKHSSKKDAAMIEQEE